MWPFNESKALAEARNEAYPLREQLRTAKDALQRAEDARDRAIKREQAESERARIAIERAGEAERASDAMRAAGRDVAPGAPLCEYVYERTRAEGQTKPAMELRRKSFATDAEALAYAEGYNEADHVYAVQADGAKRSIWRKS